MENTDKAKRHWELFRDKFEEIERCAAQTTRRPNTYLPRLASLQFDLACACMYDDGDFESAERLFADSAASAERYTGRRKERMTHAAIMAAEGLAEVYSRTARLGDMERALLRILEHQRELAREAEYVYAENVAVTTWRLGNLYVDMGRYADAETMYLRTLEQRKEFDGEDTLRYRPATAQCHRSLGRLYQQHLNDSAAAEKCYKAAICILEELCLDPCEGCNHLLPLAAAHRMLAALYDEQGRNADAERHAAEAERIEMKAEMPY